MGLLYVIVFIVAVTKTAHGACCNPSSVIISSPCSSSAYEIPTYQGYPITNLPIKACPCATCPQKPCGLPTCQPYGLPTCPSLGLPAFSPSLPCVPTLSPSSSLILPSSPLTNVDYASAYGNVVQVNDNTVANGLANLLQMLVVSNMLGSTLPVNKLCAPGAALPGSSAYW